MSLEHSVILDALEEVGKREREAFLDAAHNAGKLVYDTMLQDAQKRGAIRDQKNQEETAFLKSREMARYKNQAALSVNEHKIRHINALLDEVYNELESLDNEAYLDLLYRSLNKQKTDEKPRIHVASKHFDLVVEALGQTYQIIKDESIGNGFILNYTHFNVNMELKQIMRHKRDNLTNKAMDILYGGDDE